MKPSITTPQSVISVLTGLISAGMFFLLNLLNWFLAYSTQILIVSCILLMLFLLVRFAIKNDKAQVIAHYGLIFCGVMAICSGIGVLWETFHQNSNDKKTRICDCTEFAINYPLNVQFDLDFERITNNTIRFYAGPWNSSKTDAFLNKNIDISFARTKGVGIPFYPIWVENSNSKFIVFDTEWGLKGFEGDLPEQLPLNVNLTITGVSLMKKGNWDDARRLLSEASEQGNGAATYYLHFIYSKKLGSEQEDDRDETNYLKNSADQGYRRAQLEYGKELLSKGGDIDIALGVQYLKRAASLSDIRTPGTILNMLNALSTLQDYFTETKQFDKAYSFTKRLIKENKMAMINYPYHLENCLFTGHYLEAMDIIQKGMNSNDSQDAGFSKVIQAQMFSEGLGVKKDLRKAELALRFASDSLDFMSARKKLSELYSQEGFDQEAEFWQRLYDIRFQTTIND